MERGTETMKQSKRTSMHATTAHLARDETNDARPGGPHVQVVQAQRAEEAVRARQAGVAVHHEGGALHEGPHIQQRPHLAFGQVPAGSSEA